MSNDRDETVTDERLTELADKKKHFATACMDMWNGEPVGSDEVVRMARELLARRSPVSEARVTEGWQPIETAPKDGTPILLGIRQTRTIFSRVACAWRGFWRVTWTDEPLHAEPTHWQPLPAPPPSPNQIQQEG